jgi:hypothetical protein
VSDTGGRDDHDEVGSLADETAKLLGALSGWARDHAGDLGDAVSDMADHAAALAGEVDEHLATGAAECTYCPICRTVHVVRTLSPEVRTHLASAAGSLAQAMAALMAPPAPPAGAGDAGVEHIDLDD